MADFRAWSTDNLVKFCVEASERIAEMEEELRHCKGDLKAAMEAYRDLNKEREYE